MVDAGVDGLERILSWAREFPEAAAAADGEVGDSGGPVGERVVNGLCKDEGA